MATPTAATIRSWSKVDLSNLGYDDDTKLQVLVDRAVGYVEWATGRELDSIDSSLQKVADQAVQVLTETLAFQSQEDIAETAADFMLISSFSAGAYSETRRSLTELKQAGMINANPVLHGLLWGLLTDDKRDDWLGWLMGANAPAFAVTEVDWSGGAGVGLRGGLPPDPWPPLTD